MVSKLKSKPYTIAYKLETIKGLKVKGLAPSHRLLCLACLPYHEWIFHDSVLLVFIYLYRKYWFIMCVNSYPTGLNIGLQLGIAQAQESCLCYILWLPDISSVYYCCLERYVKRSMEIVLKGRKSLRKGNLQNMWKGICLQFDQPSKIKHNNCLATDGYRSFSGWLNEFGIYLDIHENFK